jgi:hypothetical protein
MYDNLLKKKVRFVIIILRSQTSNKPDVKNPVIYNKAASSAIQ